MDYMKFHTDGAFDRTQDGSPRTAFAPLNPAHLTHEPVRRRMPWGRFAGAAAVGALVVEALRLTFGG